MESVSAKKIETEVKGGLQMGVSMKFTDLDQYLFGQGTNYEVYKKLGAHPTTYRRKKEYELTFSHSISPIIPTDIPYVN